MTSLYRLLWAGSSCSHSLWVKAIVTSLNVTEPCNSTFLFSPILSTLVSHLYTIRMTCTYLDHSLLIMMLRNILEMDWCLCPKFLWWNPTLKWDGMRRWGLWEVIRIRWGHESGVFMREIRGYKKKSATWKRIFTIPQSCWHPGLRLLDSRSKFLLVISHSIYGPVL